MDRDRILLTPGPLTTTLRTKLDEAGEIGAAAACAVMIACVSSVATLLFWLLSMWIERRTQAWKA